MSAGGADWCCAVLQMRPVRAFRNAGLVLLLTRRSDNSWSRRSKQDRAARGPVRGQQLTLIRPLKHGAAYCSLQLSVCGTQVKLSRIADRIRCSPGKRKVQAQKGSCCKVQSIRGRHLLQTTRRRISVRLVRKYNCVQLRPLNSMRGLQRTSLQAFRAGATSRSWLNASRRQHLTWRQHDPVEAASAVDAVMMLGST